MSTAVENRGPQLQAVCIVLLVLTLVTGILRVYVRVKYARSFRYDDLFMALATVRTRSFVHGSQAKPGIMAMLVQIIPES